MGNRKIYVGVYDDLRLLELCASRHRLDVIDCPSIPRVIPQPDATPSFSILSFSNRLFRWIVSASMV
jgi:hypothetical protein